MQCDYVATIRGQSAVGPMQSKKFHLTRFYTSALGAEPCICARPLLSMESSEISTFSLPASQIDTSRLFSSAAAGRLLCGSLSQRLNRKHFFFKKKKGSVFIVILF